MLFWSSIFKNTFQKYIEHSKRILINDTNKKFWKSFLFTYQSRDEGYVKFFRIVVLRE